MTSGLISRDQLIHLVLSLVINFTKQLLHLCFGKSLKELHLYVEVPTLTSRCPRKFTNPPQTLDEKDYLNIFKHFHH